MAYNETLAARVRKTIAGQKELAEKRMFGGLTFMVNGNMCCGVRNDDLVTLPPKTVTVAKRVLRVN